ncbi:MULTISPECIES: helix-turn-helix domain-containing protein [Microcystis]|nr:MULTISPECIES: transcriptional regulator [Microcystis]
MLYLIPTTLKQYPPRPIHNEEDLEMMQEVINCLLDKPQLTAEEREYLNVLGSLIYEYEENQEPIPDIYGIELLKFILEERNLQNQDLLSIFESKSTMDNILDGQQELILNPLSISYISGQAKGNRHSCKRGNK